MHAIISHDELMCTYIVNGCYAVEMTVKNDEHNIVLIRLLIIYKNSFTSIVLSEFHY